MNKLIADYMTQNNLCQYQDSTFESLIVGSMITVYEKHAYQTFIHRLSLPDVLGWMYQKILDK